MISRDIDIETFRHEVDKLRSAIESKDKQIQNLTEMYECALAELHKERARDQKGEVIEIIKSR